MPVQFNLKRDPAAGLIPPGVHRFSVEKAEERPGKDGPYINLHIRAYPGGKKHNGIAFEGLFPTDSSRWKVDEFFNSVGAPTEGSAEAPWFVGKTGWAKFDNKPDNNRILQSRVIKFLSAEQAEQLIAAEAEGGGFGGTGTASESRTATASSPTRKSGGKKAAVAEMAEDDAPF